MVKCVCFDLGGVVVRVRLHWKELLQGLNIHYVFPAHLHEHQHEWKTFKQFESGKCSEQEYLEALGCCFSISEEDALKVHHAILCEEYPLMKESILKIQQIGLATGCLSNTNALHWRILDDPKTYPAICLLETKVLSFECGFVKPGLEIFRIFEEQAGFSGDSILYFDDRDANVNAAKEMGWRSYVIDPAEDVAKQVHLALVKENIVGF